MKNNKTKEKLLRGSVAVGTFLFDPSPKLVELCGIVGLDYVVIDAEGSPVDMVLAETLVRAADDVGITPIIRPPNQDPKMIGLYLDMGYQGVMMPGTDTAGQAHEFVKAAKYPPLGSRGLGAGRAARYGHLDSMADFQTHQNENILLIALVEHEKALAEIEAIVSTPGIHVCAIGSWDLSSSMGFGGDTQHPAVREAVQQIFAATLKHDRIVNDIVSTGEGAAAIHRGGAKMLTISFNFAVAKFLRELVEDVRQATAETSP